MSLLNPRWTAVFRSVHAQSAAVLSHDAPCTSRSVLRRQQQLPTRPVPRKRYQHAAPKQQERLIEALRDAQHVTVTFANGAQARFLNVWLRDHCREAKSFHPATRQRLVDSAAVPLEIQPVSVHTSEQGLHVRWPASGKQAEYESFYPYAFLLKHSYDPPLLEQPSMTSHKARWGAEIGAKPPTVDCNEVMQTEKGVYKWLTNIDKYGFSFVSGIDPTPEATEALIRRIAFIRETHYGGFWDFTADLKHGDLAYSDQELGAHTDTTYFTDACGLQLFHLLSPASTHEGGHNLLVDGFKCAEVLRQERPDLYEVLATVPIPAHASGTGSDSIPSGVFMRPLLPVPVFTHSAAGELVQVRWNNEDRDVLGGSAFSKPGQMRKWYEALGCWEAILRREELRLWTKMERGTAVIFDNHRVMHGRSSFTGERRLCGAYVSGDDYRSRLIGLKRQFEPVEPDAAEREFGVTRTGTAGKDDPWRDYL